MYAPVGLNEKMERGDASLCGDSLRAFGYRLAL